MSDSKTLTTTDVTDLGTAQRYPATIAPYTREQVRDWVHKALLTEDPRAVGIPPAFRNGLILGLRDAFTDAQPLARSLGKPELADALGEILDFIKLAEVEE